jgi:hypothetical protein
MKRIRLLTLLPISVVIHFGLMFAVIVGRLDCGAQAHCITLVNKVAGALLSFPLGLVVWSMQSVGLDPVVLTDAIWGGNIFVLCAVNSVLAVVLFWCFLIKPIVRRRNKFR